MNATGKRNRGRKAKPIGKAEALQLLESAIAYCQQAGLTVKAGNAASGLLLTIDGAYVDRAGTVTRFLAGAQPAMVITPHAMDCRSCGRELVHDYGESLCRGCWTARREATC